MGTKTNLGLAVAVAGFAKFFYEVENKNAIIVGLSVFALLSIIDDAARADA